MCRLVPQGPGRPLETGTSRPLWQEAGAKKMRGFIRRLPSLRARWLWQVSEAAAFGSGRPSAAATRAGTGRRGSGSAGHRSARRIQRRLALARVIAEVRRHIGWRAFCWRRRVEDAPPRWPIDSAVLKSAGARRFVRPAAAPTAFRRLSPERRRRTHLCQAAPVCHTSSLSRGSSRSSPAGQTRLNRIRGHCWGQQECVCS